MERCTPDVEYYWLDRCREQLIGQTPSPASRPQVAVRTPNESDLDAWNGGEEE